ncbi:hypothetical protein [Nocardia blacklockiae]|uniref:hypothetical protein n=1 Tax=Nocardia blacklockiae TaxID=480036 RepID=UPI001893F63C|nr:hypothetical protein [Nocardia blacklockiae]MBF6174285.1 hypothetical protein [Nocardia blacklockiae]
MAYIDVFNSSGLDGLDVHYDPAHRTSTGHSQPAYVRIELGGATTGSRSYLAMEIAEARMLAGALVNIVMLHDAAERVAAERSVA